MAPARIPATVITGFLGAGKTTLIRNIIMQANGKRLALIVNEFGDVAALSQTISCRASSSFWRRNRSPTTSLSKHPDSPCRNRLSRPLTGPTSNRR